MTTSVLYISLNMKKSSDTMTILILYFFHLKQSLSTWWL